MNDSILLFMKVVRRYFNRFATNGLLQSCAATNCRAAICHIPK